MCWNGLLQPNKRYFYWHLSRCEGALSVRRVDGECHGCDKAAHTWAPTAFQAICLDGWLYLGGTWLCGRVCLRLSGQSWQTHCLVVLGNSLETVIAVFSSAWFSIELSKTSLGLLWPFTWKDIAYSKINLCVLCSRSDLIPHRALLYWLIIHIHIKKTEIKDPRSPHREHK